MKRAILLTMMASVLLLVLAVGADAQISTSATVTGTITDPSGFVVPGAEVTLVDSRTNVSRTGTTDSAGQYTFVGVEPGPYQVIVAKAGFRKSVIPSITVEVAKSHLVNVTLQIGRVSETVEVTASSGVELQTTDATVGDVIGGDAMQYLPNATRDASWLLQLQPMVAPGRGVGADEGGGVAGSRADQSTFMLDGADATDSTAGTGAYFNGFIGESQAAIPTPADSIEEFRVGTNNPNANFGRSAGGEVNLVSKHGTNSLHGTGYWYHQNSALNANTWDLNSIGAPKPSTRQNRSGASLGGPIIKDKLFFFTMYEGWRFPHAADVDKLVPTDTLRAGTLRFRDASDNVVSYDLASSTQCGTTNTLACDPRGIGMSPVVAALMKLYPAGNDPTTGDGLNTIGFRSAVPLKFTSNFGMARIDYNIRQKWNLFSTFRYYTAEQPSDVQVDLRSGHAVSTANSPVQPRFAVVSLAGLLKPNLVNTITVNYTRNWWAWTRQAPTPLVPGTNAALEFTGETGNGASGILDQPVTIDTQDARSRSWDGRIWTFRDDVTWTRGKHSISFGGDYRHNHTAHVRDDLVVGALTSLEAQLVAGTGMALSASNRPPICGNTVVTNCLNIGDQNLWDQYYASVLGLVGQASIIRVYGANLNLLAPGTPLVFDGQVPGFESYITDTWHAKPSLSLSFGLNYGVQFPPKDSEHRQTVMVDPTTDKAWTARNYFSQLNNAQNSGSFFAPTLAWAPLSTAGLKYPYVVDWKDLGPRVAVAWNPNFTEGLLGKLFGNKMVLRGGYSKTFERMNDVNPVMNSIEIPGFSETSSCIGPTISGTCTGFGGTTPQNGFRIGVDGSNVPTEAVAPHATLPSMPGVNTPIDIFTEPNDYDLKVGRVHTWDLTLQRELRGNMLLEIGYVGRHMSHLTQTVDFTQVPIFMKDNKSGQTFAQAYDAVATALRNNTAVTPQAWFEDMTGVGSTATMAGTYSTQFTQGYVHDLWTLGVQPLLPRLAINEQVLYSNWMSDLGRANYQAGFVALHKRTSHGLTFDINYTFSHILDQLGLTQQDDVSPSYSVNLNYDYGPALYDHRHALNSYFLHEVPLGKGHRFASGDVANKFLGGWFWSGIFTAYSGAPLAVEEGSCQEFGSSPGGNCVNAVPLKAPSWYRIGTHRGVTGSSGIGTSGNINIFADPAAAYSEFRDVLLSQDTHSGGGGYLHGLPRWFFDASLGKKTQLTERLNLVFTADFFNIFNHVELTGPTACLCDPASFGVLNTQFGVRSTDQSAARAIQFGFHLAF